jgi:hypothetical protein
MRSLAKKVALFSLASALAAQPAPHTTTIPKVAAGTFLGSASSFPLGRTGGRAQYWFRGDNIETPSLVTAIGPRPARNYTGTVARTQSVEITMSNSTLNHGSFTNVFAQNLGAQATIVVARRNVSIPTFPAHTDFNMPGVWIALDAPFALTGPNLVLDFDLGTAVGATAANYNGDLLTLASPGRHYTSDPSCGGALAATATTVNYDLSLSGAPPAVPAVLMLAVNATSLGPVPLPLRLDFINMPGCVLGVDPLVNVSGTTSASGTMSLSAPIAFPTAQVIYAQALHASTAVPAGLATSNVTRSIVGNAGFCAYIYNFTVDGTTAQNGPFAWQGAMLLQP